ncbi:MAG: hypothetical protein JWO11_452 [Nocardioides sp.]|nr:hypothetical protein [Nocardioides sp.]
MRGRRRRLGARPDHRRLTRSHALVGILVAALLVTGTAAGCSGGPGSGPQEPNPYSSALPPPAGPHGAPGTGALGLKWSWFQPDTFGYVRRLPGGWTFTEVEWCSVEPVPGARDWAELDRIVAQARDLGQATMIKLRTGQCWGTTPDQGGGMDLSEASRKTPSTPPTDLGAYLSFVSDLVTRYAAMGVHAYAIENEIDVQNFWAAPVATYDALARAVAPVVHQADPHADVLDAGLSSTAYGVALANAQLDAGDEEGALATYQLHYGRRMAGGVSRWPTVFDATGLREVLATEPARRSIDAAELAGRLVRDRVVDAYQLHFYEGTEALRQVLVHLDEQLGDTGRVEAWEIGTAWPGADFDERAHAEELFRDAALLLGHGVRLMVYLPLAWTDDGGPQVFRGLMNADGTLLPAGRGWLALADELPHLADAKVITLGDPGDPLGKAGLVGVVWSGAGHSAALVWAVGPPVQLPASGVDRVLDATGAELDPDLPVGDQPVLVVGSAVHRLTSG